MQRQCVVGYSVTAEMLAHLHCLLFSHYSCTSATHTFMDTANTGYLLSVFLLWFWTHLALLLFEHMISHTLKFDVSSYLILLIIVSKVSSYIIIIFINHEK